MPERTTLRVQPAPRLRPRLREIPEGRRGSTGENPESYRQHPARTGLH